MDQAQLQKIESSLQEEKAGVERQLADHGAAVDETGVELPMDEGGFADSAQATAGRSELLSFIESLKEHYDQIVSALRRIEEGTYGKCERCGGDIPSERLEAIPTARLCVTCKQNGR